jgi:hypothetical protein
MVDLTQADRVSLAMLADWEHGCGAKDLARALWDDADADRGRIVLEYYQAFGLAEQDRASGFWSITLAGRAALQQHGGENER